MSEILLIAALSSAATVYGFNEMKCGDVYSPRSCSTGAITASGEVFDSSKISAAIPMSTNQIMRPFNATLCLKNKKLLVRINDKKAEGGKGLDLSPEAFARLTGTKATKWSSIKGVTLCK